MQLLCMMGAKQERNSNNNKDTFPKAAFETFPVLIKVIEQGLEAKNLNYGKTISVLLLNVGSTIAT